MSDLDLETAKLTRAMMTAVNQQFGHMMILRTRGRTAVFEAINKVDQADYRTSMLLLERVVTAESDVVPLSETLEIGGDEAKMIAIDLAMEDRLEAAIDRAELSSVPFTDRARAPRADHRAWLSSHEPDGVIMTGSPSPMTDRLNQGFRDSIGLMEQALAHAYVHRARQADTDADAAWAVAGGAMIVGLRITGMLMARGHAPTVREAPEIRFSRDPAEAIDLDRAASANLSAWFASLDGMEEAERKDLEPICSALGDWPRGETPRVANHVWPKFLGFEKMHRRIGL